MSSDAAADIDDIIFELPGFLHLYRSGRVERIFPDELVPTSLDPSTGVQSKDINLNPSTGLSVRLYLPPSASAAAESNRKLPVLLICHGGGFCILRASSSIYHSYINHLTAKAGVLTLSVDYRLAPENPLPAAYDDSWEALQWVTGHARSSGPEPWLSKLGDFDKIFIAGESAGGNIVHNLGMRLGREGMKVEGLLLVQPYFWGKERIGDERKGSRVQIEKAESLWRIVCPGSAGLDDPRINPVTVGAPDLAAAGFRRALVCVAELDLFKERGRIYYEKLKESGWGGEAEFLESEGEDHGFFLLKPESAKAEELVELVANFLNKG